MEKKKKKHKIHYKLKETSMPSSTKPINLTYWKLKLDRSDSDPCPDGHWSPNNSLETVTKARTKVLQ
jgi:hypothetical protein